MAHPMFALLVDTDPEMRQRILDGRKSISIRRGHKDYGVGAKLMLSCHRIPWAALATISSVRHTTFHALRIEELMDDGFLNHDLAMIGLKKYYPNLNQYTAMTVIRWRDVEGFFVRHAVQHRSHPTALYRSIPEYYRRSIT
jgi:hypothetical protein